MIIIPAIDLMGGRVVRLRQGRREAATVYPDAPVTVAKRWEQAGATWLHVVDLDGAFTGSYKNLATATAIIQAVGCAVELSGGIRTEETLAASFAAGAKRVVLGTKACEDPAFVERAVKQYGDRIAVAIDARGGMVAARGWEAATSQRATALAQAMERLGVATLICTDISRDGTLSGPNITALEEMLRSVKVRVIASGGVSSLADLTRLKPLAAKGLHGVIVGKALYENKLDLRQAIRLVESVEPV